MVQTPYADTQLIETAQRLPAAPRLLVELGRLIGDPRVDAREVTALLRQDPALVSRLIAMANSAAYVRAEPAGSLEEALGFIGFREAHRLVGAVAATQIADRPLRHYGVTSGRLRENSLFVAVTMEELAEATGEDPASAYTVGLLRSVGKMALDWLGPVEPAFPIFPESGCEELEAWEQRGWGTTNVLVAEKILRHWRLPNETISAVRHHYHPLGKHNPVIHLLVLAACSAEDRCYGLPGEATYWKELPEAFRRAGLDERTFQRSCERAQRTYLRLHSAVA